MRKTINKIVCDNCDYTVDDEFAGQHVRDMEWNDYLHESGWSISNEFQLDMCPACWHKLRESTPIAGDKVYQNGDVTMINPTSRIFVDAIRQSNYMEFVQTSYDRLTDFAKWEIVVS